MNVSSFLAIKLDDFIERTASAFSRHSTEPRPGNEGTGRRFVKSSISVSEGFLGGSGSHPRPLRSISFGP